MMPATQLGGAAACTQALAAPGAGTQVRKGEADLLESKVERVGKQHFAISLTALNSDGYEIARCVAVACVDGRDDGGNRRHDVFRRYGGRPTDDFRVVDGVRTQTTTGLQTYIPNPALGAGEHDGRVVMAVDVQLARCDRAGLLTAAE